MTGRDLERQLAELERMAECLARAAALLGEEGARTAPGEGAFTLVEHVWHLADLEIEGYGVRLRRLRAEEDPAIPDFDGARLAQERHYRRRSLSEGLARFAAARRKNIMTLRAIEAGEWSRGGVQEGVGVVRLEDVPRLMAAHDAGHRAEIQALLAGEPAAAGESACA